MKIIKNETLDNNVDTNNKSNKKSSIQKTDFTLALQAEEKSPKNISFEDYKVISNEDLKKFFEGNESYYMEAIKIKETVVSFDDEVLGEILYKQKVKQSFNLMDEFINNQIDSTIFFLENKEDKKDLEKVEKSFYENNKHQKKISAEAFFQQIDKQLEYDKKIVEEENEKDPLLSPFSIDAIYKVEARYEEIKAEYNKKIDDKKSLENYYNAEISNTLLASHFIKSDL